MNEDEHLLRNKGEQNESVHDSRLPDWKKRSWDKELRSYDTAKNFLVEKVWQNVIDFRINGRGGDGKFGTLLLHFPNPQVLKRYMQIPTVDTIWSNRPLPLSSLRLLTFGIFVICPEAIEINDHCVNVPLSRTGRNQTLMSQELTIPEGGGLNLESSNSTRIDGHPEITPQSYVHSRPSWKQSK